MKNKSVSNLYQVGLVLHTSLVLISLSCSAAVFNIDSSRSSMSLSGTVLGYASRSSALAA